MDRATPGRADGRRGRAILGAALASTDPVLLRGILRNPSTPEPARNALRIESGMNDAVLLPIILVAMAALGDPETTGERAGWARTALEILVLGGAAGAATGLMANGLHLSRGGRATPPPATNPVAKAARMAWPDMGWLPKSC